MLSGKRRTRSSPDILVSFLFPFPGARAALAGLGISGVGLGPEPSCSPGAPAGRRAGRGSRFPPGSFSWVTGQPLWTVPGPPWPVRIPGLQPPSPPGQHISLSTVRLRCSGAGPSCPWLGTFRGAPRGPGHISGPISGGTWSPGAPGLAVNHCESSHDCGSHERAPPGLCPARAFRSRPMCHPLSARPSTRLPLASDTPPGQPVRPSGVTEATASPPPLWGGTGTAGRALGPHSFRRGACPGWGPATAHHCRTSRGSGP